MRRRDVPKALLLSAAAGASVVAPDAQAQACSPPCYPLTAAEAAAGITTVVEQIPPYEVCGESRPERFGAVGNNSTNDYMACQRAINVVPRGGVVRFSRAYAINESLRIDKALTIVGAGYDQPYVNTLTSHIRQTATGKNVFTLVPSLNGYAFGAYGIVGVKFQNLAIRGSSNSNRCAAGIGVDTTVNGGNVHIQHLHVSDCSFLYCQRAVDLQGSAYLNEFRGVLISSCNTGVRIARGNAIDNGGQTRFYACSILFTATCFDCTETIGGDFAFFGCTLSSSYFGIRAHEETLLTVVGCMFESNAGQPDSAAIFIEIADAVNPNTDTTRTILGNKFLFNTHDIYFKKTSQAFASGWRYPTLIDGNVFLGVLRFHASANAGTIVIGATNAGTGPGGSLADAQLVNFADSDLRAFPYSALKRLATARALSWHGRAVGNQIVGAFAVPAGATVHLLNLDRCTFNPTTGARSPAGCALLGSGGTVLANFFGNGLVPTGASWTNNGGSAVDVRLMVNDNGSGLVISVSAMVSIA